MNVEVVRKRIRQLREEQGLRAEDMAKRVGISRPFYTQLEGGTRGISAIYLFRIAKALDMTVGEVCGETAEDVGRLRGHLIPVNNLRVHKILSSLLAEAPADESDWQIVLSKAAAKLMGATEKKEIKVSGRKAS